MVDQKIHSDWNQYQAIQNLEATLNPANRVVVKPKSNYKVSHPPVIDPWFQNIPKIPFRTLQKHFQFGKLQKANTRKHNLFLLKIQSLDLW